MLSVGIIKSVLYLYACVDYRGGSRLVVGGGEVSVSRMSFYLRTGEGEGATRVSFYLHKG